MKLADAVAALRARAGIVGLLECCRCEFPLVVAATRSGHDEHCPAHGMTMSSIAAGQAVYAIEPRQA